MEVWHVSAMEALKRIVWNYIWNLIRQCFRRWRSAPKMEVWHVSAMKGWNASSGFTCRMHYVNVSGVVVAPPKSKCNTCLQRLVLHFQSIFQCFRRVVAPPKWKCDMCVERHMSMLQALHLRPQNGSVTRVCDGSVIKRIVWNYI